jgi:hypothetical protein
VAPVDFLTATLDRIDRLKSSLQHSTFLVIDRDIPPAWKIHQQVGYMAWKSAPSPKEQDAVALLGPYGRAGWPFLKSMQVLLGNKTSLDLY